MPVIGSYVPLHDEGETNVEQKAVYSEVSFISTFLTHQSCTFIQFLFVMLSQIYWVKEDKLGSMFASQDYDRGNSFNSSSSFKETGSMLIV
jgi:hypothetical protein